MEAGSPEWLALAQHYQTHAVPQRYNAGVVFASIAVSVLGCYTTLLLLGRRTSKGGMRDFLLLVMSASTMSGVGIWGMHFIGMHMRLEATPGVYWYILFNPLWTCFSLFVPLVALSCTFLFLGSQARFSWSRVVASGILFGGICAIMHYTAAFSCNFRVTYAPLQTTISVVIACSAATVALLVFFKWRNQWQDNWWKRLICATILAAGVSSMHYCGVGGTAYFVRMDRVSELVSGKKAGNIMAGAISAMCGVLCLISFAIVLIDVRHSRQVKRKAHQIFVAAAVFDKKGNLLVKADGTLPMQVVYTSQMPKNTLAELEVRQPLFQWLYSLAWDWSILDPFADRIAARAFGLTSTKSKVASPKPDRRSSQPLYAFSNHRDLRKAAGLASFKDRFIECTFLLAHELGLSYQNMGILFDRTVITGTHHPASLLAGDKLDQEKGQAADDASVYSVPVSNDVQEGGMLLLVREISEVGHDSVDAYLGRGFRFSETRFLAPVISTKMGMDRKETAGLLRELKIYAKRGSKPVVQPKGVYVGVFAVQPSNRYKGGLDTLVYGFARHQFPAYRLPDVDQVSPAVKEWLASMMGSSMETVRQCAFEDALANNDCIQARLPPDYTDQEAAEIDADVVRKMELAAFQTAFYVAVDAMCLAMRVVPHLAHRAILSSEILDTPSCTDDSTEPAQVILFHTVLTALDQFTPRSQIIPEYGSDFTSSTTFVLSPYSLFSRAQSALLRGKASKDFAREARIELHRRYPNHLDSPSLMDEIYASPQVNLGKKRRSMMDMSPIVDRSRQFAKLWEKKEPGEVKGALGLEEKAGQHDDYPLKFLASPLHTSPTSQKQKRASSPTLDASPEHSDDSVVAERTTPPRRASTGSDDLFKASPGSSGQWITPPPAFKRLSTPPSTSSLSPRQRVDHRGSSVSASQALLAAMSEAVGSPGTPGSLPSYRSPVSSPPPLVPLPTPPPQAATGSSTSPRLSRASGELGKLKTSRRSVATRKELAPPIISLINLAGVKPLATAARLRNDGWCARVLGEIEHSTNADELNTIGSPR